LEKIAFIINPNSGLNRKKNVDQLIEDVFPVSDGYELVLYRTKCAGDATVVAKGFVEQGFDKVVAIGGDGTVNEVARSLVDTNTVFGIVPYGSGNGLARHLKIPLSTKRALETIRDAKPTAIDCCMLNNTPFFCTAGAGFDAQVGIRFARDSMRGLLTYVKHIIGEFATYRSEKYKITLDGQTIERDAFLITFANASQWGNNAHIAPKADISDGLLDVVIMSTFPVYRAPQIGVELLVTKRIDQLRYIEVFKCKHAILERPKAGYIHYDGEPVRMGKVLDVQIKERALKVLA
jgi:YegS/Rv2252/BmrU family lipid kinase